MVNKRILVISGSPRKDGNIAKMINLFIDLAKRAGNEIDFIDLYECNIEYCKGCMACKSTGICFIKDDIVRIREKLIKCNMVVLASPTYFANVTAPVKNMFDRLVGAVMDDNYSTIPKPKLSKNQEYVLMTTCTTPAPFDRIAGQSSGCLKAMKEVFHISGMKCREQIVFAGTRGKTELPKRVIKKIEKVINNL